VSWEFVLASEEECKGLRERRFDDVDILIVYIDGMVTCSPASVPPVV